MDEFTIRDRQIDALENARLEEFEKGVVQELRENFPEALAEVSDQSVREFVQSIEALAMNYELETEEQIRRLAVYAFGARTFLRKIPQWFDGIMNQTQISPANRIRMLALRLQHAMSEAS